MRLPPTTTIPRCWPRLRGLDHERRADRLRLWSLVSDGPAQAMGLHDRGRIEVGKRADLVLVDWPDGATPAVQGTWVAGRAAYRATPLG
ncbi:MAG: amidohydrolase family protein [Pseudomonadota bacterium]